MEITSRIELYHNDIKIKIDYLKKRSLNIINIKSQLNRSVINKFRHTWSCIFQMVYSYPSYIACRLMWWCSECKLINSVHEIPSNLLCQCFMCCYNSHIPYTSRRLSSLLYLRKYDVIHKSSYQVVPIPSEVMFTSPICQTTIYIKPFCSVDNLKTKIMNDTCCRGWPYKIRSN